MIVKVLFYAQQNQSYFSFQINCLLFVGECRVKKKKERLDSKWWVIWSVGVWWRRCLLSYSQVRVSRSCMITQLPRAGQPWGHQRMGVAVCKCARKSLEHIKLVGYFVFFVCFCKLSLSPYEAIKKKCCLQNTTTINSLISFSNFCSSLSSKNATS